MNERAAVVLRCLRRAGWTNLRIQQVIVADLRSRNLRGTGVLNAEESSFYSAMLSAIGVD